MNMTMNQDKSLPTNTRRHLISSRQVFVACLMLFATACFDSSTSDGFDDDPNPSALSGGQSTQSNDNPIGLDASEYAKGLGKSVTVLTSYTIKNGEIVQPRQAQVKSELESFQGDSAKHAAIWSLAKGITKNHLGEFGRFVIFTDGKDESLATVFRLESDPKLWVLGVDIQDAFTEDSTLDLGDFVHTLVHEYGHVLSLNHEQFQLDEEVFKDPEDQDLFDSKKEACDALFLQEGCANENAFMNTFYDQFWAELEDEFSVIDEISDDDERDDAKEAFFAKYETRFVSEYAATNVTEDFAESWTHFVLKDKPDSMFIRDEKVLFFYNQPELVTLRDHILAYLDDQK